VLFSYLVEFFYTLMIYRWGLLIQLYHIILLFFCQISCLCVVCNSNIRGNGQVKISSIMFTSVGFFFELIKVFCFHCPNIVIFGKIYCTLLIMGFLELEFYVPV